MSGSKRPALAEREGGDVSWATRLCTLVMLVQRYGPTSVSSSGISAAHFLLQVVVLRSLGARQIGVVAFVLTMMQFALGISNALIAAPYSILLQREGALARSVLPVNAVLCLSAGLVCGFAAWLTSSSPGVSAGFGITIAAMTLRWFGRTRTLVVDQTSRATLSDLIYAAVLSVLALTGFVLPISMVSVAGWLVTASLLSLLPFVGPLSKAYSEGPLPRLVSYRPIWQGQARWSLLGVATTEATSNAHVYLVTAFAGTTALAPLAVGALFLRPLSVCITAITQIERPRMVRQLIHDRQSQIDASVRHFRSILLLIWIVTVALAAAILILNPGLVERSGVNHLVVIIAVVLSSLIALPQCLLTPWSVLLQAADRFKPLAYISVRAAGLTLVGALVALATLAPVWSLLAVMVGQVMMAVGARLEVLKWRRSVSMEVAGADDANPSNTVVPLA